LNGGPVPPPVVAPEYENPLPDLSLEGSNLINNINITEQHPATTVSGDFEVVHDFAGVLSFFGSVLELFINGGNRKTTAETSHRD